MAKDWVERHLQEQNVQQQRGQREQIKAQHALAGAVKVFQRLGEQVQRDLTAFCRGSGDGSLQYQEVMEKKFRVRRAAYPSVTLDVELTSTTIEYERTERFDDTSRYLTHKGAFRIWSDLAGNVQIYRNGTPFVDESEVSQLLLEPVLTYIETI